MRSPPSLSFNLELLRAAFISSGEAGLMASFTFHSAASLFQGQAPGSSEAAS